MASSSDKNMENIISYFGRVATEEFFNIYNTIELVSKLSIISLSGFG